MDEQSIQVQRDYWNQAFAFESATVPLAHLHWLDILLHLSSVRLAGSALEIGCGRGYDTNYLFAAGCNVTCLDLAWNALQQVAKASSSLQLVNAALPAALPFQAETFHFVVAGLSLHYFLWQDTCQIIREIGRVLQPGGTLIFRVNSIEDVAHGAGRGEEIEPQLYLYEGRYKRFFTEPMCRALFDHSWQIEVLVPWTETRSESAKPTWMGIVHRLR